jgi:hypothetical protein
MEGKTLRPESEGERRHLVSRRSRTHGWHDHLDGKLNGEQFSFDVRFGNMNIRHLCTASIDF